MHSNLNLESLKFEIQKIQGRTSRSTMKTNYFDQSLKAKSFKVIQFRNSLVFIDKPSQRSIGRFFYFLANGDYEYCIEHNFDYDLVCDIVDVIPPDYQLDSFLSTNSFIEYAKLKKMSLTINSLDINNIGSSLERAKSNNIESIFLLFKENFDNFTERPPSINEIEFAIKNDEIYCKFNSFGDILGFYWNRNKKFLSELKYLFVVDKYRGLGIGKELLNEYFVNTSTINRKQLWVLENNISAINLYKKYGYGFDGLVDHIFIRNNIT